jgi:hypothetical protein
VDARYCCSATTIPTPRVCTLVSVIPPHFRRPSLLLFSLRTFSSRPIPSHLKTFTINQSITAPVPHSTIPSHNICTFTTHTPRRKFTACALLHVCFFRVIIALSFEPWRAPLLSSWVQPFSPSQLPHPRPCSYHTPTRFSETFTRTNTYIQYPLTPALPMSDEKNPLLRLGPATR